MSTVLWRNSLKDGEVTSDQEDLYALFKYTDKLDAVCKKLDMPALSSICDSTDMLVNLDQLEMPDGMEDTNQLMAAKGVWIDAAEAKFMLEKLLAHIAAERTRFGLLKDKHEVVVEELETCVKFAGEAADIGAKFNFAIVM